MSRYVAEVDARPFHLPVRPTWRCVVCGDNWPCEPARIALLNQASGDSVGLLVYLAAQLMDAIEDLGDAATFERFLVWARSINEANSHTARCSARY